MTQHSISQRQIFINLLRLAWPYRWRMLLSVLLGVLTIGSSISLMSVSAWVIATAALHPSIAALNVAIVGVRFFGIARGVFRYLERYVAHDTTFRLLARLRVWFYRGLEPLAPARLLEHRSGDLLARIVADIDTLENVFLRVIAPPLVALVIALSMGVFMALHDVRLALSLLIFLALAGIGVPLLTRRLSHTTGQQMIATRAALTTQIVDSVQGLDDLVAYGAADRHIAQLAALNRATYQQQTRMARIGGLQTALMALITGLAMLSTLVIAIPLVETGAYSGVILAVLALATLTAFEAVQPLPTAFQHVSANLAAARRLFEIAGKDIPGPHFNYSEREHTNGEVPSPRANEVQLPLEITDLHFRYTPVDPPALNGVSLTLAPGQTVAVVGASGAGKSTLVNLLLRFWAAAPGAITVNGTDLAALPPDDARTLFSVVSQRTHLFNGTIAANLRLAAPDASAEEMIRACTIAQLHTFITTLPEGYDTWIGEQGLLLSGGERQRLAIARAILKDAPFLLLDEPTANLDPLTARAIMDTILDALADRTTLMITHQFAGLERADRVYVLNAGRVVEQGTHADLMQIDGHYRRLWTLQHAQLAVGD